MGFHRSYKPRKDLLGSDLLGFPALGTANVLIGITAVKVVIRLLGGIIDTLLYGAVGVEVVKVGCDLTGRWSPPLALRSSVTCELRGITNVSMRR